MAKTSILVAGATGYIGRAVVASALAQGHQVYAMVRRPDQSGFGPHPNLHIIPANFQSTQGWVGHVPKASIVISCLASRTGTPKDAHLVDYQMNAALLSKAQTIGAEHFILLSAICVQKPRLAFQFEKLRFEADLQASTLRYSIVRPTAYFKSLSGQVKRIQNSKPFLVFGSGSETACTPISERDLANYLLDCVKDPTKWNRILPIGGPKPALTPNAQAELMAGVFQKPLKIKRISPKLFDRLGWVLSVLAPVSQWARDKSELMKIGKYYATESMLCWDPETQSYDETSTPSTGSDRIENHFVKIRDGQEILSQDPNSQIY